MLAGRVLHRHALTVSAFAIGSTMNRPRDRSRRNWPDYLKSKVRSKGLYYIWKHPITKKEYGLGYSFAEAAAQAREANLKIMTEQTPKATLADRISDTENTMSDWLDRFKSILNERPGKKKNSEVRAQSTMIIDARRIETMREHFKGTLISKISTKDCADLIQKYKDLGHDRAAADMRGFMIDCFNEAESAGWIARGTNPASITKARKPKTKRSRLSLENYMALLSISSGYIKTAMLLALVTGQREGDIANMKYADAKHGFLEVVQEKGGNRIRIPLGLELLGYSIEGIIKKSRVIVGAKSIVHQTEKTARSLQGAALRKETICKTFTSMVREHLKEEWEGTPPTFHEIRSLSKRLHDERGVNTLLLLGHSNEQTGQIYNDLRGGWVEIKLPKLNAS